MACEALCVVRTRSYLFPYGLNVMGVIITQGVREYTWHRFTAAESLVITRISGSRAPSAKANGLHQALRTRCERS